MRLLAPGLVPVLCVLLLTPETAVASEGKEDASVSPDDADIDDEVDAEPASASVSTTGRSRTANDDRPKEDKWIHRWAPVRNMGELGIYGGVFLPSRHHELFEADPDLPDQGWRGLRTAAPDFGIRGGYYPLRFLGLELETGVMPTRTDNDQRATVWTFRGHIVGQLGLWSVTPFVLAGIGALGIASDRDAVGNDVDMSLHFGAGVKFYLNRWAQLRLDVRDVVSARRGVADGVAQSFEVLLGFSVTFGRKSTPRPATQEDAPRDSDGDGFLDDEDKCPNTPGVAPDGCPVADRDGDGFPDDEDKCPDEPGIYPDGCPRPDRDGDGIPDELDKCPDEPETWNGYLDTDGCPDELPAEVAEFRGALEGIQFDVNKDTIKPGSRPILDQAAEVLKKHPDIRVEIGGHTDSTGSRDLNLDLSRRRARSVKRYLVSKGVDDSRVETRGYGPDKAIADNDTPEGRTKNRRIEFTIIQ